MTLAWTLGFPAAYDRAILIPGNAKAPGGYAFRTRAEALAYVAATPEASSYGAYRMYLPGSFDACTTDDWYEAAVARHRWHTKDSPADVMPQCGVCVPRPVKLDCRLLLVEAPFQKEK